MTSILDLEWKDLEEWGGSKIVSRGKGYTARVADLRLTADDQLLAWVAGTHRYATMAWTDQDGELDCRCACPYDWGPCKHAVAVVLRYLEEVKAGHEVPAAADDDERLLILADFCGHGLLDWEDDEDDDLWSARSRAPQTASRPARSSADSDLKQYLDGLPREELTALAVDLAARYPKVADELLDRARLVSGDVSKIVASIGCEIEELADEPDWEEDRTEHCGLADFSRVRERLEALLDGGHAEEVVALGEPLLEYGLPYSAYCGDDGEWAMEVGACLDVVIRALPRSSISPPDQLMWLIEAELRDDYGVVKGCERPRPESFPTSAWDAVASTLIERLGASRDEAVHAGDDKWSATYQRRILLGHAIDALGFAGRDDEATRLLGDEASVTGCHVELVDRLIAEKRYGEARERAMAGFTASIAEWPGLAFSLEERLRNLAEVDGDTLLVASYRALEFFHRPGPQSFAELDKAARQAGVGAEVRAAATRYLETGERLDRLQCADAWSREWPLPALDVQAPDSARGFPMVDVLLAMAIEERDTNQVLRWYEELAKRSRHLCRGWNGRVAEAVQEDHPDVALGIWRRLAEAEIAQVKRSAYEIAGMHLRRMEAVYRREGRLDEWRETLAQLRSENRRRPRMLEVLDTLESRRRRIIDT